MEKSGGRKLCQYLYFVHQADEFVPTTKLNASWFRYTMVPASLYLGFAASIIWVAEVRVHLLIWFNYPVTPVLEVINFHSTLTLFWAVRGHILLPLHAVMHMIATCMKELWLVNLMENSGECLPVIRWSILAFHGNFIPAILIRDFFILWFHFGGMGGFSLSSNNLHFVLKFAVDWKSSLSCSVEWWDGTCMLIIPCFGNECLIINFREDLIVKWTRFF